MSKILEGRNKIFEIERVFSPAEFSAAFCRKTNFQQNLDFMRKTKKESEFRSICTPMNFLLNINLGRNDTIVSSRVKYKS